MARIVALAGVVVLLSTTMAACGDSTSSPAPAPSSTAPVSMTVFDVASSTTAAPPPILGLSLAVGWSSVPHDQLYLDIEGYRPSVSAAPFPTGTLAPSTHCDFPVGLAERLPADGVAVSVRLAAPGGYGAPFPSSSRDLWPTAPPESAYANCLERDPDFHLFTSVLRFEGRDYSVYVFAGLDAPPGTRAELESLLGSLRIDGRSPWS